MKDWPPVFTLLLPFVGWLVGEFDFLFFNLVQEDGRPLKWLLVGLCVGLAADLAVALWDWLSGERTEPAKPDTQPPTKVL